MSLNSRRAIEAYKANHLQAQMDAIHAALGKQIPIEVNWSDLDQELTKRSRTGSDLSNYFADWCRIAFFGLATEVFKKIGSDDGRRKQLQESISKIIFKSTLDAFEDTGDGTTLQNGVLTFDDQCVNLDPVGTKVRFDKVSSFIEAEIGK